MEQNRQPASSKKHLIAAIAVTFVFVVALVWINVYMRSVRYAGEGDALLAEGKLIEAVTSYEIAAHAYTPWNRHVARSMQQLWEIGGMLERQHDDPTYPLIAYRSLRSSVYAIRSFYMPYKEWIPRCDEKIEALVAIQREMMERARSETGQEAVSPPSGETHPGEPAADGL